MNKPIIEVKGLGKKYRIGAHKEPYLSLRDSSLLHGQRSMNHGGTETRSSERIRGGDGTVTPRKARGSTPVTSVRKSTRSMKYNSYLLCLLREKRWGDWRPRCAADNSPQHSLLFLLRVSRRSFRAKPDASACPAGALGRRRMVQFSDLRQ